MTAVLLAAMLFSSFVCGDDGVAVGIDGNFAAIYGNVPVLAFSGDADIWGFNRFPAPADHIICIQTQIFSDSFSSQSGGM